jgi:hypothetical protein
VNRCDVENAIRKKLNTLVRVSISLSVKNHVSDDVMMPVLWLPESTKDGKPLQLSLDADWQRTTGGHSPKFEWVSGAGGDNQSGYAAAAAATQDGQELQPQLADAGIPLSEVEAEDESPDYSYRLASCIWEPHTTVVTI